MVTTVDRTPGPAILPLVLVAWLLTAAAPGQGQVRISGQAVTDSGQRPIQDVAVTALDTTGTELVTRLSGADGRFTLLLETAPADVRLRAERIGYRGVLTPPIEIEGFRSLSLELRLSPDVVPVAPLQVTARQRRESSPVHEGFRRRRANGFGEYITRRDIERRSPPHVTDLLRRLAGVNVSSSGRAGRGVVSMGRGGSHFGGPCPAQVYVDNFHVNRANGRTFRIDDVVSPDDVEGIEVYRGLATVPAQFLSPEADCGVIVIWTRRGPG